MAQVGAFSEQRFRGRGRFAEGHDVVHAVLDLESMVVGKIGDGVTASEGGVDGGANLIHGVRDGGEIHRNRRLGHVARRVEETDLQASRSREGLPGRGIVGGDIDLDRLGPEAFHRVQDQVGLFCGHERTERTHETASGSGAGIFKRGNISCHTHDLESTAFDFEGRGRVRAEGGVQCRGNTVHVRH